MDSYVYTKDETIIDFMVLPFGSTQCIFFNPLTAGFSDELYSRLDKPSYLANYT